MRINNFLIKVFLSSIFIFGMVIVHCGSILAAPIDLVSLNLLGTVGGLEFDLMFNFNTERTS
ncbi:MAG: hypothetical protein K8S13_08295 [Desulfobacula sp.]|uniref:hypothetical protein n=1 Tax=Desulfobacula sp. TaxID=2593537 RepID=UPI0025BEC146|nr:hypothetical protein [Desulfobacula sp.]MCD4719847.1 hypothetical protein [Desulfobacula sp.]